MINVLVVDSNERARESIVRILQEEELTTSVASTQDQALSQLEKEPPDAVIVSLRAARGWEQDLCREIRERTIAPLLILARRGQELALAHSLNTGGDAHVLNPATRQIVLSQLYALLRRVGLARPGHAGQLDIGTLAVNVYRREVRVHGELVELTPTEFGILRCLLNNAGRGLSYRSLVRQVQGYDCSAEEARELLKVHIHNLRNKIEPAPRKPVHILNVRGFGYLFERRRFPREGPSELV